MSHKPTLLIIIIGAHLLAFIWLDVATRYRPLQHTADRAMRVDFIVREMPSNQPVHQVSAVDEETNAANPLKRPQKSKAIVQTIPNTQLAPSTLTLINKDGSIILPQQTRDEFLNAIENREFDVQRKGLDGMDAILHRPAALEYKASVFDKEWQGDKPRLSRILEEAVAKSTVRVKIPVPGRPGAYLRCGVAILALGGGCGFTANDDGYYVRGDDPNTLSPEEDRQCKAWWDLIVSAKTQAVWRKTEKLYRQECEKPLAK